MTSGVYPRKPGLWAGNGGKRHHAPAPKFDYHQAATIRMMRNGGTLVKVLCHVFKASPGLIYRVLNKEGAYA